jgi:hypothetical protein
MPLTLKVDISKKGITVSNHEGSISFDKLNHAAKYMARAAAFRDDEEHVIAQVTIYDNFAQKQELLQWLDENPVSIIDLGQNGPIWAVSIAWRVLERA